jgi:acetolactate synthase-1/2/3 large subunit
LGDPDVDFVSLGTGLGVASRRADDADQLTDALSEAVADPGPHLIEVVIPTEVPPPVILGYAEHPAEAGS